MSRHRGHDPTRRNRNIGTGKQGHGRDNRMGIPWPDERHFTERLVDPVLVQREIHGDVWGFVVEPTLRDSVHACTLDDIQRVLELLPAEDLEGVRTVVLRQPTRKQTRMDGVWGRWCLTEALGPHDRKWQSPGGPWRLPHGYGPAIFLEAVRQEAAHVWSTRMPPEGLQEIERRRADGHRITNDGRRYIVHATPETSRVTQLYHTLAHEVGHHAEYWRKVMRPSAGRPEGVWRALNTRYWSMPVAESETFANRYADEFRARMLERGEFPFERLLDLEGIVADGLEPRWFTGREEEAARVDEPAEEDASPAPRSEPAAEPPARTRHSAPPTPSPTWPPETAPRRGGSVAAALVRETMRAWWGAIRRIWRAGE